MLTMEVLYQLSYPGAADNFSGGGRRGPRPGYPHYHGLSGSA